MIWTVKQINGQTNQNPHKRTTKPGSNNIKEKCMER